MVSHIVGSKSKLPCQLLHIHAVVFLPALPNQTYVTSMSRDHFMS